MSERHGVLTWTPDGWRLSDSGSSNGTAVNGERLDSEGEARPLQYHALNSAGVRPVALVVAAERFTSALLCKRGPAELG